MTMTTMNAAAGGRRRFVRLAAAGLGLAAVASAGLSGCAAFVGSHTVTISESEITLLLARQFPMERKVLEVVDLSASNPLVHLLPETNRLGTELDFAARDRLFGTQAQGHLSLDYGLRFEASDHTIRMTGVRVLDLRLASGSSSLHGTAQRLGTLVAEDMLEDRPLYRMKASQADEMDRLNLVASPITVTPQGLQMTLSPRP